MTRLGTVITVALFVATSAMTIAAPAAWAASQISITSAIGDTNVLINNLPFEKPAYEWVEGSEFTCTQQSSGVFRCAGTVHGVTNRECVETVSENHCSELFKTCRFVTKISAGGRGTGPGGTHVVYTKPRWVRYPYNCSTEAIG